jgi:site-specific DNA-methyltransferase (adenine-specific)
MEKTPVVSAVPVADLIPYARNSRTHDEGQVAQIAASLDEFGMVGAIVVRDGVIAKGHGTLAAIRKLYAAGKKLYPAPGKSAGAEPYPDGTAPVLNVSGWTDAQFRAYVIADNKLALNAGWDEEMLRVEFDALRAEGYDTDVIGFSTDELVDLFATDGDDDENPGDAENEPTPAASEDDAVSEPGDVWICGDSRLMCGDSTSIEHMQTLTAGRRVDMWLTDPPYNVAYEGKTKDALKIKNDAMGDEAFRQFLRDAYAAADSVMKPGAVFYIWHADSEGYNFRGAARDVGWKVRQCLIWEKQVMVMGRQDYHWQHEPCLYGWKEGASHLWASDRKQTTLLKFDRPSRNGEHPTMKPVALFEYQMLNNTKGGDIVLDSFSGSGTTLIACAKNGREARVMELSRIYSDVGVRRWQEYTGKVAVLEGDGRSFEEIAAARGKTLPERKPSTDTVAETKAKKGAKKEAKA